MIARPTLRISFLQACLLLGLLLVLGRAAQLQLFQGEDWAQKAEQQRTTRDTLEARRGSIYDRRGTPLAVTQEFYHVGVAPNEVKNRREVVKLVSRALRVPAGELERRLRTERYVYYHGPYTATDIEPLRKLKGVHAQGSYRRSYPTQSIAAPVVGRLDADSGAGGSGLERALDDLLTGRPGEAVFLRDRRGRRLESPARRVREPVPGNDAWLTVDYALQDIAERALEDALHDLAAEGGDIVVLDPRSGEVLAIASRQTAGVGARPTAFTDPFEPGSTAKLFTAAALLRLGRVDSMDVVNGHCGKLVVATSARATRVISDVHGECGDMTLSKAITVSSNVAMAQFSQRLDVTEQFTALRDFGFGSPTGIEFPSESRGALKAPEDWQANYTRASAAMGYEFGVTALQLAAAYGAIANDGVLLAPTLVREVRAHDGSLLYRHQPEPVRRVIPPDVAATLMRYLRQVVSTEGTARGAQLANYEVAGKTGTARRFIGGRYQGYTASFAALFPADDPQLVIVVKINNPTKGSYYGGATAVPLTKQMLERMLAARNPALDFKRLQESEPVPLATREVRQPEAVAPVLRVAWPYRDRESTATEPITVPEVAGQGVREAVLALHRKGLRVTVHGTGIVARLSPAAGSAAAPGTTVELWTDE
jgi:cell division protein FtsI (penicillin-binding protein 3)